MKKQSFFEYRYLKAGDIFIERMINFCRGVRIWER